jgi:hypothetical protein
MHGDKKWIRDRHGRLKKSSDRTSKDWLGDLNNQDKHYSWRNDCDECRKLTEYYNGKHYKYRWLCAFQCESCKKDSDDLWESKWSRQGVPSWYTREKNQKYRTTVKQILRNAKYDEELYDTIPPNLRNAAWDWW